MNTAIRQYNQKLGNEYQLIAERLTEIIDTGLPGAESKIWHAHPVWFIEGNPITGYSLLKDGIRLMFWSGQSFQEAALRPSGKFKAAEIRYQSADQIEESLLQRCLIKAREIQWDYKNIVKRKGVLLPLFDPD